MVTFDFSDDLATFDGIEAVTYTDPDDASTTAVTTAKACQISTSEAGDSNGKYQTTDVAWSISRDDLTSQPKLGGTITDSASDDYTILSVGKGGASTRWRCVTRDLAISENLTTLVKVWRNTPGRDAHGATTDDWTIWKDSIRGRIQEGSREASTEKGTRYERGTHTLYLASALVGLNAATDRITDGSGETQYNIVSIRSAETIGQLTEVSLIKSPWAFA